VSNDKREEKTRQDETTAIRIFNIFFSFLILAFGRSIVIFYFSATVLMTLGYTVQFDGLMVLCGGRRMKMER